MANDSVSLRSPSISADYDVLVAQLAELRTDVSKLASSVGTAVGNGRQTLMHDVSEGVSQAAHYVGRKGHDADVRLEGAISTNPYIALAVAAGAGALIGVMTRR